MLCVAAGARNFYFKQNLGFSHCYLPPATQTKVRSKLRELDATKILIIYKGLTSSCSYSAKMPLHSKHFILKYHKEKELK